MREARVFQLCDKRYVPVFSIAVLQYSAVAVFSLEHAYQRSSKSMGSTEQWLSKLLCGKKKIIFTYGVRIDTT